MTIEPIEFTNSSRHLLAHLRETLDVVASTFSDPYAVVLTNLGKGVAFDIRIFSLTGNRWEPLATSRGVKQKQLWLECKPESNGEGQGLGIGVAVMRAPGARNVFLKNAGSTQSIVVNDQGFAMHVEWKIDHSKFRPELSVNPPSGWEQSATTGSGIL